VIERYLVDTSAWVEYLTNTGSPACLFVDQLAEDPYLLATTQPVLLELRVGARGAAAARRTEAIVGRAALLDVDVDIDFDVAGDLYHAVLATGHTVRSVVDCLIAAVAIRTEAVLVHRDRDFDRISAVATDLQCAGLDASP
jgi:predicted nucleic acid-binding protein